MKIDDLPPKYQEQAREKLAPTTPKNAPVTNKYRNVKETIGNIKFDSQKEKGGEDDDKSIM